MQEHLLCLNHHERHSRNTKPTRPQMNDEFVFYQTFYTIDVGKKIYDVIESPDKSYLTITKSIRDRYGEPFHIENTKEEGLEDSNTIASKTLEERVRKILANYKKKQMYSNLPDTIPHGKFFTYIFEGIEHYCQISNHKGYANTYITSVIQQEDGKSKYLFNDSNTEGLEEPGYTLKKDCYTKEEIAERLWNILTKYYKQKSKQLFSQ